MEVETVTADQAYEKHLQPIWLSQYTNFPNSFQNYFKSQMDRERDNVEAEQLKNEGNNFFKVSSYAKALDYYTQAVEKAEIGSNLELILLSNRAFCHIKMENHGLAIIDADQAIKQNPEFTKAYYRKGQALLMLSKLEDARDAFKVANKLTGGKDKDILEKLNQIKKTIYEREFAKSIATEDSATTIDVNSIEVPSSYDGPRFDGDTIDSEWCLNLMNYLRDQKKIHKKYLVKILNKGIEVLSAQPSIQEWPIPDDQVFTVCGDTHGQFYDLLNIFKINGNPSENRPYLFNGDFVDRGSFSLEVILTLLAWKVCNPNIMHLTRGNHESRNLNKLYGFEGEVKYKYDDKVFELFQHVFNALPLGYVLNKKVMVVHGGLFSKDGVTIQDLQKINRFRDIPESGLMADILWSDPSKLNGRHPSKRGISIMFGPDVAHQFLKENNLELLVRSHEMKDEGYEVEAFGKVITIFSAPNYCDQMKNKGAFIHFKGSDMIPKFTQFEAVEHPKIPPMAYSRGLGSFF